MQFQLVFARRVALLRLDGGDAAPRRAHRRGHYAIGAIPRLPRTGWRRRDWLLVSGAALAGLVVAGAVLRRRL